VYMLVVTIIATQFPFEKVTSLLLPSIHYK
jgi:hypothetical protein